MAEEALATTQQHRLSLGASQCKRWPLDYILVCMLNKPTSSYHDIHITFVYIIYYKQKLPQRFNLLWWGSVNKCTTAQITCVQKKPSLWWLAFLSLLDVVSTLYKNFCL